MSTVTPSSPVEQPLVGAAPREVLEESQESQESSLEDKAVDPVNNQATAPGTGRAAWDPLASLATGTAEPTARFQYDVLSGDWWWSPGMFDLHGLTDGEVVPTTDLLMAHKHPEDLASTEQSLRSVLATGEPFCCRHRVIDSQGSVREVLSVGEAVCDGDGRVTTVQGYFIDLTTAFTTATERASASVLAVEQRRLAVDPLIEQAKGVLIAAFRLSPDAAVELLAWRAEEIRVDLSVVSRGLVAEFHSLQDDNLSAARRACAYLGLNALDED